MHSTASCVTTGGAGTALAATAAPAPRASASGKTRRPAKVQGRGAHSHAHIHADAYARCVLWVHACSKTHVYLHSRAQTRSKAYMYSHSVSRLHTLIGTHTIPTFTHLFSHFTRMLTAAVTPSKAHPYADTQTLRHSHMCAYDHSVTHWYSHKTHSHTHIHTHRHSHSHTPSRAHSKICVCPRSFTHPFTHLGSQPHTLTCAVTHTLTYLHSCALTCSYTLTLIHNTCPSSLSHACSHRHTHVQVCMLAIAHTHVVVMTLPIAYIPWHSQMLARAHPHTVTHKLFVWPHPSPGPLSSFQLTPLPHPGHAQASIPSGFPSCLSPVVCHDRPFEGHSSPPCLSLCTFTCVRSQDPARQRACAGAQDDSVQTHVRLSLRSPFLVF